MTFPNLQQPQRIVSNFNNLENSFPEAFTWAGEINVFKHALASNGFFEQEIIEILLFLSYLSKSQGNEDETIKNDVLNYK